LPNEGGKIGSNVLTNLPSMPIRQQQTNSSSSSSTMHQPLNSNRTSSTMTAAANALSSILGNPHHPPQQTSTTNSSRYIGQGYNQLAQIFSRQQSATTPAQSSSNAAAPSAYATQFPAPSGVRQTHSSVAEQRAFVEQILQMQQLENIQQLRQRLGMGGGGNSTGQSKGMDGGKQPQNQQQRFG
jgi:hypothetical protein